jgi:uncharacterized membrane protein
MDSQVDVFETCKLNNPDDGFQALECVAKTLSADTQHAHERIDSLSIGIDVFFLLFASVVMFTMQAGFAMLCAGSVRRKNVQNTLLKNVLDACGCGVAFFVCGKFLLLLFGVEYICVLLFRVIINKN